MHTSELQVRKCTGNPRAVSWRSDGWFFYRYWNSSLLADVKRNRLSARMPNTSSFCIVLENAEKHVLASASYWKMQKSTIFHRKTSRNGSSRTVAKRRGGRLGAASAEFLNDAAPDPPSCRSGNRRFQPGGHGGMHEYVYIFDRWKLR